MHEDSGSVLLVNMPWGSLSRPALGISLLKAGLAREGIPCDVRYLNIDLAATIGFDEYQWIGDRLPYVAFAGDWLFTHTLYGEDPAADQAYLTDIARATWRFTDADLARLLAIRSRIEGFIAHCLDAVPWSRYRLVGFTSTFEQNIASLALARRVKERHPDIAVAFGGANWEGPMGLALHEIFPFVDFAVSGEADHSLPALVRALRQGGGGDAAIAAVPGVVYRVRGQSLTTGPSRPVTDMDALPYPDFSDYFTALEMSPVCAPVVPVLLLETSRGCWWGAKSHCTFCGLNGGSMAFRAKSADRVLAEIDHLVGTWRYEFIEVVDNILDMKYFNDLLPALAERSLVLFCEVKSNLTRQQVAMLARAGVGRIQPGIESLSDHVLALMRKGTTALRNIQLLKWCTEYGVGVSWNILYGFPGERAEDYERVRELLPSLRSFEAPSACGPVRLDRFSPYFDDPQKYGIVDVRPSPAYRFLYPHAGPKLPDIANFFDYRYSEARSAGTYAAEVIHEVQAWQAAQYTGSLQATANGDLGLVLVDTRTGAAAPGTWRLEGLEREAYVYCDQMRTASAVARHLNRVSRSHAITEEGVRGFLDSLVANRLMVSDGSYYLSLALFAGPSAKESQIHVLATG